MSNDTLLQVAHGQSSLLFGSPSEDYKEACMKELIERGFDEEKYNREVDLLKKREVLPLDREILILNILFPFSSPYENEIKRFHEHGFRRKINQDLKSRFVGFILWAIMVGSFLIYIEFIK
ncbi:hypothetical protein [Fulvivirga lutimaris]|uniref:hypothetical protein n=1 Tax=Fulvivirga lutimaris TaxID=1819566 RepID=UPI0012BD7231|nr:hypothetical protein [Fulvivirga lutimaris]MTI40042.1 hypothetical protein [Fulvivirga lutimaris]